MIARKLLLRTVVVALLAALMSSLAPGSQVASPGGARRRRVIGQTVQGRPLIARFVGNPDARRTALVVGCIHGDECAGRSVVRRLLQRDPPPRLGLWLIFSINRDGSEAGTRQNARGVDLNRNFPRRWQLDGSPWSRYYSGPSPASEPETRAAIDFIKDIRPDVTVWYHQPLGYIVRSAGELRVQRAYARTSGMPLRDYPGRLHGTATMWQNHRYRHKTAFVVELYSGPLSSRGVYRHVQAVLEATRRS